jgi:hypothetical protein
MPSLFNHENDNEKPIADETDKRRKEKKRVNDEKTDKRNENSERIDDANKKTDKQSENDKRVESENKIRVRKETLKMITKTFEPKEMLPFSQLRTLNQKDLLHSLEENDKLGIVIKDQLKVAMIDMDKYQMMVEALQEYERLLDLVEERELYERIGHRLESNRVVEYKEGMSLLEMAGVHPGR